jgi:hypothetical protein
MGVLNVQRCKKILVISFKNCPKTKIPKKILGCIFRFCTENIDRPISQPRSRPRVHASTNGRCTLMPRMSNKRLNICSR